MCEYLPIFQECSFSGHIVYSPMPVANGLIVDKVTALTRPVCGWSWTDEGVVIFVVGGAHEAPEGFQYKSHRTWYPETRPSLIRSPICDWPTCAVIPDDDTFIEPNAASIGLRLDSRCVQCNQKAIVAFTMSVAGLTKTCRF